ncbi:MAG: EcoRV family type II restriction endonuclease [Oscillospiraceae bacterium]|nr:EcoRV family type II restriction endonuclease [Oscillospiraceae bacterium]
MNKQALKLSDKYSKEKERFHNELSEFAQTLEQHIALNGNWTVKGFIDVFKNIYTISSDTKVISKILELHLFPHFIDFARRIDYTIELTTHQNWYPDLTFINKENSEIKFAVDLKTTYINEKRPEFCNGFTLGSHGEYFINRDSSKNIQYPYSKYIGHFCLGIIYSRAMLTAEFETKKYSIEELADIPSVINSFRFFAIEKWRIASDKGGSGNTANIGSIKNIKDILAGNGVFAKAGEEIFDDYWANYGKIQVESKDGNRKPMTSFDEYIKYRSLSIDIKNRKVSLKGGLE